MISSFCTVKLHVKSFLFFINYSLFIYFPLFRILELQKLKAQVVTDIRSLAQLEGDLNLMDIKIGLLVKNRITLQVNDNFMHFISSRKHISQYRSSSFQLSMLFRL